MAIGPTMDSLGEGTATVVDDNSSRFNAEPGSNGVIHISPKPPQEQLIAGKFKSQDDLLKAYKELEAKLGAPKEPEATPAAAPKPETPSTNLKMDTGQPKADDKAPAPKDGDKEPAAADGTPAEVTPLDFTNYSNEFFEKGELSEDSYKALEKDYKLPKDVVDTFIEGQQAILTLRGQSLYDAAGGKEAYTALTTWGAANLPAEQKAAFNTAIDTAIRTGDTAAASLLISAVKAQMGGGEPRYVSTQNKDAGPAVQPFANRSEMTAAMRDPRYRTDAAYEQEVRERLRVSNF